MIEWKPRTVEEESHGYPEIIWTYSPYHSFFTHIYDDESKFHEIFEPDSTQIDVYMSVVHPLISEVLAGYNCTVFVYGKRGTGKTFTMEGQISNESLPWNTDSMPGIIPRSLKHLLAEVKRQEVDLPVSVSYIEVHKDNLYDLLPRSGPSELNCSHTILSITVKIPAEGEKPSKRGKLNLVDLVHSESIEWPAVCDEAGNINQTMQTLGSVVRFLVDGATSVPFRCMVLQACSSKHTYIPVD
ncbi:kinesin-like protein KLP2 [Zootermopsis nevadensis]|uniref:kinesin-like protein KLP2 n=1 Tax=Zootermopsis nevadensis TaxID=136037 RepID=UPI000B8E9F3E|nr:kinesin-like protein KLP2 [Zootermopsis nevadensis]